MKQVWKFKVDPNENPIQIPACAELLSVGFQGDDLFLWALVDIEANEKPRNIVVRGTGHNIRLDNLCFIGTAFKDSLVFHVFEAL
jgi:hypothetical protein